MEVKERLNKEIETLNKKYIDKWGCEEGDYLIDYNWRKGEPIVISEDECDEYDYGLKGIVSMNILEQLEESHKKELEKFFRDRQ